MLFHRILIVSLLVISVHCAVTDVCESTDDCTCHDCNSCFCEEPGTSNWACTEIGCPQNCASWEMEKNTTGDGRAVCDCKCAAYQDDYCTAGDCTCDQCNMCHCDGGSWACTEMGCIADDCVWTTQKSTDSDGNVECSCNCIPIGGGAEPLRMTQMAAMLVAVVARLIC